jgi:hypothetical protein
VSAWIVVLVVLVVLVVRLVRTLVLGAGTAHRRKIKIISPNGLGARPRPPSRGHLIEGLTPHQSHRSLFR